MSLPGTSGTRLLGITKMSEYKVVKWERDGEVEGLRKGGKERKAERLMCWGQGQI